LQTATAPPGDTPPRGGLAALRHRNFRVFYVGQLLSLCGTWMQSTAQGWLVLELTDSSLLLGVVTAAGSLPSLVLTLWAGVVADRGDKRRIILIADVVMMLQSFALAALTYTGYITFPTLLLLVLVLGAANAFEVPTRQSFFVDLVGKEDLPNAIALNSAAFNATRIVGPALAGWIIGALGTAACFLANGLSYLAVIAGVMMMKLPAFVRPARTSSALEDLREGVVFIGRDPLLRTLVGLIAAMSITAFPFAMLLPVFARDVLGVGAEGLGWLLAATGVGALAGGVALAAGGGRVARGKLLIGASVAFCLFLFAFTFARSLPMAALLLGATGFSMILNNATLNALLQSLTPNALRGRVMSVYVFMFLGMTPVGALQAGALSRVVGAPAAVAVGASVLLLIVVIAAVRVPELWKAR
jgi:predicted MFS family arabinose efflux permease